MSGGVDSAVAALLVARAGRQAVGVTLELWSDHENDGDLSCCSAQAVRGARELAHELGMPHLSIDLRAEFRAGVVDRWLADHASGLTPNPCVRCNGNVRLDAMLELASALGSQTLATGHYARVIDDPPAPLLRTAADERKDQSYVLAALAPESLARLRFPLGDLHKPQVREPPRAPGWRCRAGATPRTCASWREPGMAPSWSGTEGWENAPVRSSTRRERCSASTQERTPTPSGSVTASASPRPSRCTCSPPTLTRTASPSGLAARCLHAG